MRCTYIGLAAALGWSGLSIAQLEKLSQHNGKMINGHRVLADVGSHIKNASSVSYNKLRNGGTVNVAQLELRQAGGQCGQQYGKCPDNLCCSDYGFCGDSVDHCAPLFSCQPQYGVCGWPRAAPVPTTTAAPPPPPTTTSAPPPPPTTTSTSTPPPPPPPTTTSAPPPPPTTTSAPPPPPTTTSVPVVIPPSSTTTSAGASTTLRVTTNGMCGNGTVCVGSSQYGPCCSQFFWCGSSLDFCGAGCQGAFGACFGVPGLPGNPNANASSSSVPVVVVPPTSSVPVVVPPTTSVVIPPTTTTSIPVISTTIISLPPPTTRSTTSAPPPPPSTTSTTSARPTTTAVQLPPGMRSSTDGKCGDGVTCLGSTYGRCCSQFGWCGDGDQFCPPIVGCQPEFGTCSG